MPDLSPVLSMPFILPAQAQKHVTHNEALRILDVAVQLAVRDADRTTPPVSPEEGARHLVAGPATGDWAGQEGRIALWTALEGWQFTTPAPGWRAWVIGENRARVWTGAGWSPEGGGAATLDTRAGLEGVGVNASADMINRLSVAAPASLFSHEGAGHQLKINKAVAGDTASLLFQTGFEGRAELGTAGTDAFDIKVSSDGTSWVTALRLDPVTGHASGAAVQADAGDVTPGRLARVEHTYGPATLLGPVSQAAGLPTGAVIERGATAAGEFVRFADGTLIATVETTPAASDTAYGALFHGDTDTVWSFPQAFAAPPVVTGQVAGGPGWVEVDGATTLAAQARRVTAVSTAAAAPLRLLAVGRWV